MELAISTIGKIHGNNIYGITLDGIILEAQSKVTGTISDNIITKISRYGINVRPKSSAGTVAGNVIYGCAKGAIQKEKNAAANIGENYYYQGDYVKALEYHSKALTIRQAILEPIHPDIANSLNNIGCDCIDIGKYDMALECLNTALVIWTNVYGEKHPEVRKCRGNIGSTYLQMGLAQAEKGEYQASFENLNIALPIMSEVYGEDYETVVDLKKTIELMKSVLEQK